MNNFFIKTLLFSCVVGSTNFVLAGPPGKTLYEDQRDYLVKSTREKNIPVGADQDMFEVKATRLDSVDALTVILTDEKKAKLRRDVHGGAIWLVDLITFRRDQTGERNQSWTRQFMFEGRTLQPVYFTN